MAKREREPMTEPADEDTEKTVRVTLPLKGDGTIDWGRMRESTRGAIQDKLRADPVLAVPGGSAERAAAAADTFPEPLAIMLLDIIGQAEVAIVMSTAHCAREDAAVFLYADADKALLSGPLVKVLNKYGTKWLSRYTDEVVLAALLVSVHAPKVIAFQEARQARQKPKADSQVLPFVNSEKAETS